MDTLIASVAALEKEFNALRKDVRKIRQHIEDPSGEKRAARAQNNGFNKPVDVSDDLRKFLNLAEGEKISRSQVNRLMNQYYEANGLKAGQNITMNDALKGILTVPEGVQLTYLNMQKYINRHYIKAVAAPVTTDAPPAEKKSRPKVVKA